VKETIEKRTWMVRRQRALWRYCLFKLDEEERRLSLPKVKDSDNKCEELSRYLGKREFHLAIL